MDAWSRQVLGSTMKSTSVLEKTLWTEYDGDWDLGGRAQHPLWGNWMLQSVQIENFRCFERFEVHGLTRVNVIVGPNSSGKTAFLEALFLAAGGSPEIVLRLRNWRGLGDGVKLSQDRRSYEILWQDFFFSLDQSRVISISMLGSAGHIRSVKVFYNPEASQSAPTLPLDAPQPGVSDIVPITLEWRDSTGKILTAQPTLTEKGLNFGGSFPALPVAFFASTVKTNPAETADRFSSLSKRKKEKTLIDVFRSEFPYVEDLSVEINAGIPMLYASIDSLSEKLPIADVSGGANKLVSILTAIANFEQGIVLVDEIDNGFYYKRLSSVWRILLSFCRQFDTQIFVSTHNRECLAALSPILQDNEEEFCLIRTEKADGYCAARVFGGRDLKSAITQEVEVR